MTQTYKFWTLHSYHWHHSSWPWSSGNVSPRSNNIELFRDESQYQVFLIWAIEYRWLIYHKSILCERNSGLFQPPTPSQIQYLLIGCGASQNSVFPHISTKLYMQLEITQSTSITSIKRRIYFQQCILLVTMVK